MSPTVAVRLLTDRVSPAGVHYAGDVVSLPEGEARRLIADRQAEPEHAVQHEAATVSTPRQAAVQRRPKKG